VATIYDRSDGRKSSQGIDVLGRLSSYWCRRRALGTLAQACAVFERLLKDRPEAYTKILAATYGALEFKSRSRYEMYQSRFFNFKIKEGEKVLDIGSGHMPFPLATHLADVTLTDDDFGRAGMPIRNGDGRPLYECNIENMPFQNHEFDFVYCSHVLEHVADPERACGELVRVGKRGFIETPTRGKDLFLNTARVSGHRWAVEKVHEGLIFTEYAAADVDGLDSNILLDMNCAPQTERERAFAGLMLLRADRANTMLLWEEKFSVEVRRCAGNAQKSA
jgi:SAM-dependent methyltransferase